MKILNLYGGIGGNRKLWGSEHDITTVEIDRSVADIYKSNFPTDRVVVGDAVEYLLNHFDEYDFIWASPPCPSHSRMRTLWSGSGKDVEGKVSGVSMKIPDMSLYGLIIFLKQFFRGDWVVENVISYYDPLIKPFIVDNHYFWSNKELTPMKRNSRQIRNQDLVVKSNALGFDISAWDLPKRKVRNLLNNCVYPEVGLHVFNDVFKSRQECLGVFVDGDLNG